MKFITLLVNFNLTIYILEHVLVYFSGKESTDNSHNLFFKRRLKKEPFFEAAYSKVLYPLISDIYFTLNYKSKMEIQKSIYSYFGREGA